ncbi:MAG: poly(ADP-ribose) glycohydrolase [Chloroflexi bacterium]|nr:poly(ADP-ribose) glycohydrolase [Chloroflexota bacterium]
MNPISSYDFDAGVLMRQYPPRWQDPKKLHIFQMACSSEAPFEGQIAYRRWAVEPPPRRVPARGRFAIHPGTYTYGLSADSGSTAWHVNFADAQLFRYYSSSLMAQDELQVAEHPILGSLREALVACGHAPQTVGFGRTPSPITISGIQRRVAFDTSPNPAAGRPRGLYGQEFEHAALAQVESATKPLDFPTITNILAMAAPTGSGDYIREDLAYILNTAYTGFLAARQESERLGRKDTRPVIHTGFWGCGAFGGHRMLMTLLQALAGDLAEVDIEFWAFNQQGFEVAEEAIRVYENMLQVSFSTSEILEGMLQSKFRWGVPDGN